MTSDAGWSYQTSGSGDGGDSSDDFNRLTQLISSNIQKIQQNVSQIQRLVAELGTPSDSAQLRDRLHEQQHATNSLAKESNLRLKDLANLPLTPDQRQFTIQKDRLTGNLMTVLKNFQSIQREAVEKEKASVIRARANSSFDGGYAEEESIEGRRDTGMAMSPSQKLQMEQNLDLRAIQKREEDIHQLESDIRDVNQIFKEVAIMIHEQGELVDSIEANVDDAVNNVVHGSIDIQKASHHHKSTRKKKIICSILLILVVIIVGSRVSGFPRPEMGS